MLVVLPKVESSWVRESVLGLARALKGRPDPVSAVDPEAVAIAARALRSLGGELPVGRTGLVAGAVADGLVARLALPRFAAREVATWSEGALVVEGTTAVEVRAVTREPDGDGERARVRLTLHTTTGHLPPAAPVVTREIEVSLVRPRGYRRWRVSGRRCLMVL